jgi:serine protease Do
MIGIRMQTVSPDLAKGLGKGAPERGALVSEVTAGSPADKAGAKAGDVIVAVDGRQVSDSNAVQRQIITGKVGSKVDLTVWRDGQTVHVQPVTTELPSDDRQAGREGEGERSSKAKLGLGLQSMNPGLAQQLGVDPKVKGAVIMSVREGSPAQEVGLQQGDIIVEVDRKPVSSADEAAKQLGTDRAGGHLLRVRRGDVALFIVVPQA